MLMPVVVLFVCSVVVLVCVDGMRENARLQAEEPASRMHRIMKKGR